MYVRVWIPIRLTYLRVKCYIKRCYPCVSRVCHCTIAYIVMYALFGIGLAIAIVSFIIDMLKTFTLLLLILTVKCMRELNNMVRKLNTDSVFPVIDDEIFAKLIDELFKEITNSIATYDDNEYIDDNPYEDVSDSVPTNDTAEKNDVKDEPSNDVNNNVDNDAGKENVIGDEPSNDVNNDVIDKEERMNDINCEEEVVVD